MPQTESFICLEAEANESEGKSDGVQGSEGKRNINLAIAEASILSKAQRSKHIFITSFFYITQVLENILLNYNIYNYLLP